MRTTFEFDVAGTSREDINEKVGELVAKFLSVPTSEEAMSMADIELKVEQSAADSNLFTAHAHVRIRQ